jgi:hypothetical protein
MTIGPWKIVGGAYGLPEVWNQDVTECVAERVFNGNADLVASAPALLEACKLAMLVHDTLASQEVVRKFASDQKFFPFFDPGQAAFVRGVIAQAEGSHV